MRQYLFFPFREFEPVRNGLRFPFVFFLPCFIGFIGVINIIAAVFLLAFSVINTFTYGIITVVILILAKKMFLYSRIPVGTMFFLSPRDIKRQTYELQMGVWAFFIYNKVSSYRRSFIADEVNDVLRTAAMDPRINNIVTITWLLEYVPDTLPPAHYQFLPVYKRLLSKIIVFMINILSAIHYRIHGHKFSIAFSFKKPWMKATWDKETLINWYSS